MFAEQMVLIDAEVIGGDPPRTYPHTRKRYTYIPPALTDLERAVVASANRWADAVIGCIEADNMDVPPAMDFFAEALNALLAARAQEQTP